MLPRLRRYLVLALACLPVLTGLVLAAPARAICDPDQCQPPPLPTHTYSATLTLAQPAYGLLTGTDAGGNVVLLCGTGSFQIWPGTPVYPATYTDCSVTDQQTTVGLYPDDGWPSYTLHWQPTQFSSADGFAAAWTGACFGAATTDCVVANDAPDTAVGTAFTDVQPPRIALTVPAKVAPGSQLTVAVSDNAPDPVTTSWSLWHLAADDSVSPVQTGSGTVIVVGDVPAGPLRVVVRSTDAGGNVASAVAQTVVVTSLSVTSQPLPALTEHPELDFSSDDEDYVPGDAAHRQCRAYPAGATPGAWGACTTATTFAPALADGDWTLQARETDTFGHTGLTAQTTTVDATAPAITIGGAPAEGATVTTARTSVAFTIDEPHLATVSCAVDAAQPVSCTSPLAVTGYADGDHAVTITATDALGHVTTVVRHFTAAVTTTLQPTATNATVTVSYGHAARLRVAVRPASATGTVRFVDTRTGALLCSAPVTGGAAACSTSATLSPATRAVTASYAGGYSPSTARMTLVVTKAATAVRAPATVRARHGSSVTVHAYGLPPGARGTVSVYRGSTRLCQASVAAGGAYCTFVAPAAGSYRLSVRFSGDGHYRPSSATTILAVS